MILESEISVVSNVVIERIQRSISVKCVSYSTRRAILPDVRK